MQLLWSTLSEQGWHEVSHWNKHEASAPNLQYRETVKCDHCEMNMNTSTQLQQHMKNIHLHQDGTATPLECDQNMIIMNTSDQLHKHIRDKHEYENTTHTTDFQCDHCKIKIYNNIQLNIHIRDEEFDWLVTYVGAKLLVNNLLGATLLGTWAYIRWVSYQQCYISAILVLLPRLDCNRQFYMCLPVTCSSAAHRQDGPLVYDTKSLVFMLNEYTQKKIPKNPQKMKTTYPVTLSKVIHLPQVNWRQTLHRIHSWWLL